MGLEPLGECLAVDEGLQPFGARGREARLGVGLGIGLGFRARSRARVRSRVRVRTSG